MKSPQEDIDLNFALELAGCLKRLTQQNAWIKLQIYQLLFSVDFADSFDKIDILSIIH